MIGDVCTCGARYGAFRATDDAGRVLSFAAVQAMLRVGSHDPELWLRKDRRAVLRFWGQLKRDQWEVTHGYCASAAPDPEDERAADGDRSFDPSTFDNAAITPVEVDGCRCDHCTAARAVGAPLPVHRFTYSNRKARPMKTRPSTITLRRTLAAYTARRDDKRPGPVPCAVEGCDAPGKAHTCPADGERHSHGRIHYTYCHSALTFRPGVWSLVCDEHARACEESRAAFAARGVIARVACACVNCTSWREQERVEICAGLQNGWGPCTLDHAARGAACTSCQLTFNRSQPQGYTRRTVRRFVITHVGGRGQHEGLRRLTFAMQGRNTYETRDEAQQVLDLHKQPGGLDQVLRPEEIATLDVREVDCWAGHFDPVAYYIADEELTIE